MKILIGFLLELFISSQIYAEQNLKEHYAMLEDESNGLCS